MNEKLTAIKKFVAANERKILVTTAVVATSAALVMKASLNAHDNFLKDKGLYDEYYTPDADE